MTRFFMISPLQLAIIQKSECWPRESMEAHEAGHRKVDYIGSQIMESGYVYDYYRDEKGEYWYSTRMRLPNGQIVSMEKYLFGRENIRKRR